MGEASCIHQTFGHLTEQRPDSVALWHPAGALTFQELNGFSNQLANYLLRKGVGPGTLVGICLQRSPEVAISILAVLKAGGVFLPIDPQYPTRRISFICQDAEPKLLLTNNDFARADQVESPIVYLDSEWPVVLEQSNKAPDLTCKREDPAYLMYTSGTTGNPKGTLITHSSLFNYEQVLGEFLGVSPHDTYLHTASFGFSSAIRQLLIPLCRGARVVIATSDQIANPLSLFELVKVQAVTIMDIVPSYWRTCVRILDRLSEEARRALLDNHLRLVFSTGEPLTYDLPHKWHVDFRHPAELINAYGQTETTGTVSAYRIAEHQFNSAQSGTVPIGSPLANSNFYILDENHDPVQGEAVGELFVSGASVARGYLNLPSLTAERFIDDPLSPDKRERLYRTGDMVRQRQSGDIEFVGRRDFQVKINGIRVEPEEIEYALLRHPGVREAVVVVCEEPVKKLVGYLVADLSQTKLNEQLREYLKTRIPDYMIPSVFVLVDSLPRTPNGKIDRQTVAGRTLSPPQGSSDTVSNNRVEELISRVWKRVLSLEEIDVHSSFFELGGDSLQAIEMIAELNDIVPTEIPLLALFFEEPTVAGMAKAVSTMTAEQSGPITKEDRTEA